MLLTVQIAVGVAAGIVLAYVLIFHRATVMSGTAKALESLIIIAAAACLGWVLFSAIPQTVGDHWGTVGPVVGKVGMVMLMLPIFAIGALGGYGFRKLVYRLRGKPVPPATAGDNGPLLGWAMLDFLLVAVFTFGLGALGLDGWMRAVDRFGRANGMQDGLSVLLFAIVMLWPFLILGVMQLARRNRIVEAELLPPPCEPG